MTTTRTQIAQLNVKLTEQAKALDAENASLRHKLSDRQQHILSLESENRRLHENLADYMHRFETEVRASPHTEEDIESMHIQQARRDGASEKGVESIRKRLQEDRMQRQAWGRFKPDQPIPDLPKPPKRPWWKVWGAVW